MSFHWPHLLWLLFAPVALLWWEITHRRRTATAARPKILRAEAGVRSLKLTDFAAQSAPTGSLPRVWLCVGLMLCILALARPQWGRLEEPVFDQAREILLAVDLSRSMLAPDVKPSRLDRAKLLIQALLEKLAGERVGLVVFSGTAFLQSPLSADYEILREFLPALGPEFLPEGGTNYAALIDTSLQAFGATNSADRFLVVLSDGEATDESWRIRSGEKGETGSRIAELKKKGIRVIGLGVGTAGGAMIPDGTGQFVKDERGAVVLSKLESGTLQELAQATNGVYRDASAWVDLAQLVAETIAAGRKGEFVEQNTVRLVERFQWPLAFGLWCLFISLCYEFPVRPKPRDVRLGPQSAPLMPTTPASPVAGAVTLLCLGLFAALPAFAITQVASPAAAATPPPKSAAPETPALTRIVSRLSKASTPSARDWAELARETVTWGSKLQSQQQPVPEGPVRDALDAIDLGTKLDGKAADWTKLREELDALLKKPDEEKQQDQQKRDQQDKEQQQQDKDNKQNQEQQSQQQQSQDKQDKEQKDQSKQDQQSSGTPQPQEQQKNQESAFGDMNKKDAPPAPPPESTQKVGGADKQEETKEQVDPSLALPLQKLDQLRNQDSPAQLFQLIEGEKKGPKKTGKDW